MDVNLYAINLFLLPPAFDLFDDLESAYQFHGEVVLLPAAQHQTHVASCSLLLQRHLPHIEEDCWLASQAQI